MTYTLINVEQRTSKTFKIPTKKERMTLRQGDMVKLNFDDWEWLWVEVDQGVEGSYVGFLRTAPINPDLGNVGDEVAFRSVHVCEIWKYAEDNGPSLIKGHHAAMLMLNRLRKEAPLVGQFRPKNALCQTDAMKVIENLATAREFLIRACEALQWVLTPNKACPTDTRTCYTCPPWTRATCKGFMDHYNVNGRCIVKDPPCQPPKNNSTGSPESSNKATKAGKTRKRTKS